MDLRQLDMEAALPDGGKQGFRASSEWRSEWCAFIKSANTIYEMAQATVILETMIKTEYIKNTWWWYWSSMAAISAPCCHQLPENHHLFRPKTVEGTQTHG